MLTALCRFPVRHNHCYVIGFLQIPSHDGHPCLDSRFRPIRPAADFHRLEKRKSAEDAVRSLSGVISLNNQITISIRVTPQLVKEKIIKEFERNAAIDAKRIKVKCLGNKVILTGSVRSWDEKQEAAQACWAIPGIIKVDNHLVIY